MEEARSASEDQGYESEVEKAEMPKITITVTHEAKLKELLHKINSAEIKLCSDATKEFIKLLKGDSGGELLHYYVKNSAQCLELLGAWKLRQEKTRIRREKTGMFCIFKLISVILSHPDGKYRPNDVGRMAISRVLDKFARSLIFIDENLKDVYNELNSDEAKSQKAALLLLASIVRRGSGLASDVAKHFNFKKIPGLALNEKKRGALKKKQNERRIRKSFVGFAMSFLEIGTPGLLRSVLWQKEMYYGVLSGIGDDDEETVIYVLSTLRNRILVEESSVSHRIRSTLFGSVALENLVNISGRENGGPSAELAYDVLVIVCTDPSNGLMPDLKRQMTGNSKRLINLMKKLKATKIGYHRDLLLAIVSGRPSLGAAYMKEFPYNLENYASPTWFSVVTLATNLVSTVGSGRPFGFHDSQSHDPALFENVDVQGIMKCLYPRSFSRSAVNKGLKYSDFVVKHGTLRLLLEVLKLLDSFLGVLTHRDRRFCSENGTIHVSESLKQEFQNEVQTLLPDPQDLLKLLSRESSIKRTADLEMFPDHSPNSVKKQKIDVGNKDSDIVIGGISFDPDIASAENNERVIGTSKADGLDIEKDLMNVMAEIWGLDLCSTPLIALKDPKPYFHSRLLDALKIYLRIMPSAMEGSSEFFINLLKSPLASETNLQRSLLSLLIEYVAWSPKSGVPVRFPPQMHKHLETFMNLLIFSPISDIKDQAYRLAQAAMLSTGAFDRNHHEIASWFLFLPGFDSGKSSVEVVGVGVLQSLCDAVISFLCNAISTTGNNLFEYWDIVKRYTCRLKSSEGVSPHFSPLIICVLQECLSFLDSSDQKKKKRLFSSRSAAFTLPEKSMISTYACSTVKYLLQTQVDAGLLSSLVYSVLVERLGDSSVDDSGDICVRRPLNNLLLFSQCISNQKNCCIFTIDNIVMPADSSFALTPFHVLFPSIMSIGGPCSSEPFKIQELLLAKLSEFTADYLLISYLRLVLFWLYQIQSSHRVKHLVDFQQLSEICLILVENLLSQLLVLKTGCDSSKHSWVLLSSQDIQEVAETIFCHPAMITSLSCPMACCEDLSMGNLTDNMDALINLSRQRVHRLDHHALDILAKTCEYLFSLCNDDQYTPEIDNGAGEEYVKAFNVLVHKLFQLVRDKFDQCIMTKDLGPFLQAFYAVQALICFISPFELLELVHWMFSKVDIDGIDDIQKSAICFGSCIAGGAFRNLSSYLQQSNTKRKPYDVFWKMEENNINMDVVEEIYIKISKFSLNGSEVADMCLLEALNTVCRQKYMQQCNLHPLHMVMLRVIATTPVEILCHYRSSRTKARLFCLFTDMSSMHSYAFGHLYFGIPNKVFPHEGNLMEVTGIKGQSSRGTSGGLGYYQMRIAEGVEPPILVAIPKPTCALDLSPEDHIMLLPAALSVFMKLGKLYHKHFRNIPCSYFMTLLNLLDDFLKWKNFVSGDVFHEDFGEFFPSSAQELLSLIDDSLLGKAICMLRYHFALNGDSMKMRKRLKLFSSIFPPFAADDELIDCDVGGLGSLSFNETLNLLNKIYAKVSICRVLLFPIGNQVQSLTNEAGNDLKDISLDMGSNRADSSRMRFINILGGIWQWIVKRVPSVSDSFQKGKSTDSSSLWRYMEFLILKSILELTGEMRDDLIQLQSIPFLEKLMQSAILYRFEDPTTLKMLRDLMTLLSDGKFSRVPCLQLLLAHTQFVPTIHSVSKTSNCSHVGAFSRPMSSILGSLVFPSTKQNVINGKCNLETTELYIRQLEVIKLLRILFAGKVHQYGFDFGKGLGINLRELHLLLLSSYGAKLNEIDVELYNLMCTIESIDGLEPVNIAGMDYLWGSAVLKIEKEQTLEQNLSSDIMTDTEAVKECHRSQFRENLAIDLKVCASTVLYFPYDSVVSKEPLSLGKFRTDNLDDMRVVHFPDVENIERYNPIFILRFSIHSLSEGYIEPMEFAGLGLLAFAFMSMSSPDNRIRRLGYDTLARFQNALEKCQKSMAVLQIRFLVNYVRNGIKEPWQRIPSVNAIFVAEASIVLLDTSHEHSDQTNKTKKHNHCDALIKFLMRWPEFNAMEIPFFSHFFWSLSIHIKAERLWVLRLVYAGLNFDDDAQIYMKNSVLETLMSFYVSPLSDNGSKELILQVVKKSVKLHKMARYLVEQCGLFSWLSSVLSISGERRFRDEKNLFLLQLGVVSEVVIYVASIRNNTDWLQKYALENLMELTSHLYKNFVGDVTLLKENVAVVNPVLEIIISTFKISQKRRIYQPHFVVSVEGLYKIYKAVEIYGNASSFTTVEFGLKAILMGAPPVGIFGLSHVKLSSFTMWAISTALEADSAKKLKPKESHQCFTIIPEEELNENSLILKLLRWLTASVILGKLDGKFNDMDPEFSKRLNFKTLQSLMGHVKNACGESSRNRYGCEEILASAILYLQQLAGTNYIMLPSVAAALSLLLSDAFIIAGSLHDNGSIVNSLWSKIRCPTEANPSWRWSFYQPWKDLTLELTDLQKEEELHACQSLLVIISNILGKIQSELQVSSTQDIVRFGLFELERNNTETDCQQGDGPDGCSVSFKITDIGCQLVNLYSQLRQVNNAIFALCKAIRLLNSHNGDVELNYTRFVISVHEAYAKSVEMLLSSQEFEIAIHKAIKSIPEGQASGCIQQLTLYISESQVDEN